MLKTGLRAYDSYEEELFITGIKKLIQFNCMDRGRPWFDTEHNMVTVDKNKDTLKIQISLAIIII
jgi:hypothetical protein